MALESSNDFRHTVLIGTPPPPASGQSVSFGMVCRAFEELNLPHTVVNISPKSWQRQDGTFSLGRMLSYIVPFVTAAGALLLRRRRNVYLLIAQSWPGFLRDLVFISLAVLGRHRILVHLHGGNYIGFYQSLPPMQQRLVRWTLSRTAHILVEAQCFAEQFSFVPGYCDKMRVVLNSLTMDKEPLRHRPKQLPAENAAPLRIMYLSNLIETKGYLDVLSAVSLLVHRRGLNVTCHFCGEFATARDSKLYASAAEAKDDFHRRVEQYGLTDVVRWKGAVSGEAKSRELEEAHFFILPTNYCNEGQPVSIVEALAFGCAVISTTHRSIPEMLDDGRAGVFVEYGSAHEIADAVEALARDPAAFAGLSERARNQFHRRFRASVRLANIVPLILGDPRASKLVRQRYDDDAQTAHAQKAA